MIKNFSVKNFKSLYEADIKLNNFCVFIGANGSGKSNLIDSLKFIRESLNSNVGNAVSKRFGWRELYSKTPGRKDNLSFDLELDFSDYEEKNTYDNDINVLNSNYKLILSNIKNRSFVKYEGLDSTYYDKESKNKSNIESKFIRTKSQVTLISNEEENDKLDIKKLKINSRAENSLFLSAIFGSLANLYVDEYVRNWMFYDIDHTLARKPSNSEDDSVLLEDGSNLSVILHAINSLKEHRDTKTRIEELMNLMIPSFTSWNVERQFDASLGYTIIERDKKFLPKAVSDGTIRLLTLLVALLFQKNNNKLIAIDEPERCLHPQAVKILVDIMRETSNERQILITTHSSEIVKWLRPEEIYLVDKKDGQTFIIPGTKIDNIDVFLENFTMDELWLEGYLEGGIIQ